MVDGTPNGLASKASGSEAARGTLLAGRYRMEETARTAHPAAYRIATDTTTDTRVFVKVSADEAELRREADILKAVNHPGVVGFRAFSVEDGQAYLICDFVDGRDLEAAVGSVGGRFPVTKVEQITIALADAVAAIHAAGFVHRDLKPANVMMQSGGRPVIVDFGAALRLADARVPPPVSSLTDGYAAPEQYLSGQAEDERTDIYALGAIAYRLATGRVLAPALQRLAGTTVADRSGANPPERLGEAIERATRLIMAERPASVSDWAASLSSAAGLSTSPPAPPEVPEATQSLDDADGYPPTIRVRRLARAKILPSGAHGPARKGETGVGRGFGPFRAFLLAALIATLGLAAWFGWPLYERYVKKEWVVDAAGDGDARTIADAVARAGDDVIISVRPGTYAESVVFDRALHLRAADPSEPPLIAPDSGPCLVLVSGGSVEGVRFQGLRASVEEPGGTASSTPTKSPTPTPCVIVAAGSAVVQSIAIDGGDGPALLIRNGAEPQVRDVRIEAMTGEGIVITDGASGSITESRIVGGSAPGIVVRGGARPEIINNTIEGSAGITYVNGAGGRFDGNTITGSKQSAIRIASGADPTIADNTIDVAGEAGIFIYDGGRGRIENNRVVGSHLSGVIAEDADDVRIVGNTIRESGEHGVLVLGESKAEISDNTIEDNTGFGLVIAADATVERDDNRLSGNKKPQVFDAR